MEITLALRIKQLLTDLGDHIRRTLLLRAAKLEARAEFSIVSRQSVADTIYGVDRVSEEAIADWFAGNWPKTIPVELVMEGIDPENPVTIPVGVSPTQTNAKIILDPIDGTRGIMYDKRAAWFLAGVAPQRGPATRLSDIEVAVMVELPTTKQWQADRFSPSVAMVFLVIRLTC